MTEGPFMLNVDFHNGTMDVAILFPRMYDGEMDPTILRGDLKYEDPTVEVSVNGKANDKDFDVSAFHERIYEHIIMGYFNV